MLCGCRDTTEAVVDLRSRIENHFVWVVLKVKMILQNTMKVNGKFGAAASVFVLEYMFLCSMFVFLNFLIQSFQ